MTQPDWYNQGRNHLWLPYTQMQTASAPIAVERTSGVEMELTDGRHLIDGIASWWTAAHGYNHPHIIDAIKDQVEKMPHVMAGGVINEPASRLAARLAKLMPGDLDHVFFAESGSVSVEIAMKMAIQYWFNKGDRGRHKFVCFEGGYHGDTLGTMSVCDPDEGMHTLFKGVLSEQFVCTLPRSSKELAAFEDLLSQNKSEIAAVITEPLVQGAGGMIFHEPEVLSTIRQLTDKYGVLLIVDEIFTGFGRTGTMFACDQAEIVPDMMTVSKALTGGTMPLSACVARSHVYEAFLGEDPEMSLMHGPTFMANPLGCAAANASLDLFEQEPRLEQAAAMEQKLRDGLAPCRKLNSVKDVRALGAIGVVELDSIEDTEALRAKFVEKGVWVRPMGNVVYLTPALNMEDDTLQHLCSTIYDVLKQRGS